MSDSSEERRTRAKLSAETAKLWSDPLNLYSNPSVMARPEPFNGLRSRLARLPRNQRRYYRRLMRLNADRFYRGALLTLEPEEFAGMLEEKDEAFARDLPAIFLIIPRDMPDLSGGPGLFGPGPCAIHPSAWRGCSKKLPCTEFSEIARKLD
jgi:hypothetical protein